MRSALLWDFPAALVLLTRLPLPRLPERAFSAAARATWSYPLVGLLVGLIAGCVWWMASDLPSPLAAGLALLTMILITGALHEDGLADSADGLWGGHSKERRLEIMKDSHIGSYGVLALVLITGLRWQSLVASDAVEALVAAAILSRAVMPLQMATQPQARSHGLSASVGRVPALSAAASLGIALFILSLLLPAFHMVLAVSAASVAALICTAMARAKLGGITGDILGATQQISELAILMALVLAASA